MVLIAVLALVVGVVSAREDPAACREKGYTEHLVCSSCALLQTYLPSRTDIFSECQSCCANDEVDLALYTHAVLDYNPKYLDGYPGVSDFITQSLGKFPNLKVVKESRIWPRLYLVAADGKKTEEQIRYWTKEDIEEFLSKRLAKGKSEEKDEETGGWFWF